MKAYEIAEVILNDFKDYDWYEYCDQVGWGNYYESDEAFLREVEHDLETGDVAKYIAGAEQIVEDCEWNEDYEMRDRYRKEIELLKQFKIV